MWISYLDPVGLSLIANSHETWTVKHFNTKTGLPTNKIYAFAHSDNMLWAGTDSGLLSYDGKKWTHYSQRDGLVWDDYRIIRTAY